MLENAITFIMFLILFVNYIVMKKSNMKNKEKIDDIFTIMIVASLFVYNVTSYVITTYKIFSTPEQLIKYKGYEDKVRLIVEGKNSFLLVYKSSENEKELFAFPKEGDGWKDNYYDTLKYVNTKHMNFYDITLMNYQDTDDYYILV